MFGSQSWEEAESTLQKEALGTALRKAGWKQEDVRFLLQAISWGRKSPPASG